MTVREGHAIAHAVKDRLLSDIPQLVEVLIHIEFEEELTQSTNATRYCRITNSSGVLLHSWDWNTSVSSRSSQIGTAHFTWHSGNIRAHGQLLHLYPCTNFSGHTIGIMTLPAGAICCNFINTIISHSDNWMLRADGGTPLPLHLS
jgi:hypothetical protein